MFKEDRDGYRFQWKDLGDIAAGRPNLGDATSVAVYRLMQYTLRDVLIVRYDPGTASEILREAGKLAGIEFCRNILRTDLDFNGFVADVQTKLKEFGVGILRMEKSDHAALDFVMTISEDLDCSGLPLVDETICEYDEGFLAGVFEVYTGREFLVREIDCWASGERTCRFTAKALDREAA
ncbi:MAG: 4-vinyl reductase [Geobacteraceae bacterium]|nr:4-vinyl reductase [Geobacteraceae bacterium]